MDNKQVEQLLMVNLSKFPTESLPMLREKLANCDTNTAMMFFSQLKDPTIALVLSITCGYFGADRFYIGDNGIALGKLLTCGGAYIWWLIDCFLIMDATKQKNIELASRLL